MILIMKKHLKAQTETFYKINGLHSSKYGKPMNEKERLKKYTTQRETKRNNNNVHYDHELDLTTDKINKYKTI